jgi:hypothetical protein
VCSNHTPTALQVLDQLVKLSESNETAFTGMNQDSLGCTVFGPLVSLQRNPIGASCPGDDAFLSCPAKPMSVLNPSSWACSSNSIFFNMRGTAKFIARDLFSDWHSSSHSTKGMKSRQEYGGCVPAGCRRIRTRCCFRKATRKDLASSQTNHDDQRPASTN